MKQITAAKQQTLIRANQLMKEKWNSTRWETESRLDSGISYRETGACIGGLFGAAAGVLIGKAFQKREVVRRVYHEGDPSWGLDPWTEEFYSYKKKYAPHIGGVAGTMAGAVLGYFMGKNADKRYYLLVPPDIRTRTVHTSWRKNIFFGTMAGLGLGYLSGRMCYTPSASTQRGSGGVDGIAFSLGFSVGLVGGVAISYGLGARNSHLRIWEESLVEETFQSGTKFQLFPLNTSGFSIKTRKLLDGRIDKEYRYHWLTMKF